APVLPGPDAVVRTPQSSAWPGRSAPGRAPYRIRTGVTAVRGRRPGPLDERGNHESTGLVSYPVPDLNRCYRRERAASWAARRTGRGPIDAVIDQRWGTRTRT